jgi:hypothetical protein
LFVHDNASTKDGGALNAALRRVITLADYGLTLAVRVMEPKRRLLVHIPDQAIELAADRIASAEGISLRKINVNLINTVSRFRNWVSAPTIHYAVAAGMSSLGERQ